MARLRYLILSDQHANAQALDAVLADAGGLGYDAVLILGDLVGYGADPAYVIDRTLALSPIAMIRGNHDKVCAGLETALLFNDAARASAEWTASILSEAHLGVLRSLPQGPVQVSDDIEICHGTPFDEDHYVFDDSDASRAADAASRRICLFGHTHVPAVYATAQDPVVASDGFDDELRLPDGAPVLINVGSVGQPRDGDPRAAYGLLTMPAGVIRLRRVAYDVKSAQAAILKAGLPAWLALRLERGQ
jgi:diadenosine tetraphosphatase ApaH/serine/threonine PP2A family protein phosphatase